MEASGSAGHPYQRWVQFALVSAFFFFVTGATFTSLGVVLPHMIKDMSWTWPQATTGFSILALLVGLAGAAPAFTLRRFGVKATFGIGGAFMAVGFALVAATQGLSQYFIGASLMGFGYTLCAIVPGVHVINIWLPDKRSSAIGAYLTIGGFGGVASPLIVNWIVTGTGIWRAHWWVLTWTIVVLTILAILFIKEKPNIVGDADDIDEAEEKISPRVYKTKVDWRFHDAVRTPQYIVIVFSLTLTMLVGLSVNALAVGHMMNFGIAQQLAALALSMHAAVNSFSRVLGGFMATSIDPKWLLGGALIAEAIGSLALAWANHPVLIVLFVLGEGFGFGMCLFATTVLMVNYFGKTDTPALIGIMNTVTTAAMVGPVLGGYIFEWTGSFSAIFLGYSAILLLMIAAVVMMRPPKLAE